MRQQRQSDIENPLMVASLLSTTFQEKNPFVLMVGDVKRMFHVLVNLRKNMQTSRSRIDSLERQRQRLESFIAEPMGRSSGNRLDTLR